MPAEGEEGSFSARVIAVLRNKVGGHVMTRV